MNIKFTLLFATLLLSGCTTQWVKSSANAEDFTISKGACETLSEEKFPVKNEVAQRTQYTSYYLPCGKKDDCKNEKYISGQRPETQSYVMDVNSGSRQALFNQCMKLRGWTSETKWFP
ncbi:MAG: hypothetical protein EKE20_12945 [Candidatus Symbiopectobacterium sp. Dall1.0]|uniref:Lipoprotein n=1 Tax=Symbiopectobacterium purcellii TaxID=2871826 RepID=A0ABX9AKU2_9ENTR|nr:hypothetical protein [Symbiopectobacterium purcellii]MBG6242689.1 hypothetical protein [Candidatus Symbiopectobacterium sp. Dall1.0]QZN95797.1 hypothetical protein K6K13_22140 [Symbiopectobacterium purcellii]